jgi:hypothetical protein
MRPEQIGHGIARSPCGLSLVGASILGLSGGPQRGYDLREQSLREQRMSFSRQVPMIRLTVAAARHVGSVHHDHLSAKRTAVSDNRCDC